jgi:hypothetical protein
MICLIRLIAAQIAGKTGIINGYLFHALILSFYYLILSGARNVYHFLCFYRKYANSQQAFS